jgi:hypothetical protein
LRASIGAASRREDVERLLGALGEILGGGLRWRYRRDGRRYFPDPDPRPQPDLPL